jgi:hypothetical protein
VDRDLAISRILVIKRNYFALAFALLVGCSKVYTDVSLTVRQVAWPGPRTVEVIVRERQLEVTAAIQDKVVDRRVVRISENQSDELKRLFWRSWQN